MNVRIFRPGSFNSMLFPRTLFLFTVLALPCATSAQRAAATCLGEGLFRVDFGEVRLFADVGSTERPSGLLGSDIVLCPQGRSEILPTHRVFGPALTGPMLDSMSSAVGERTGVYVYARPIAGGDRPHDSFLVQWNGRRLYFSGSSDDPADLIATEDIDVAFLDAALLAAMNRSHRKVDARKVVVYHQRTDVPVDADMSAPCDRCELLVPKPGEPIQLFR